MEEIPKECTAISEALRLSLDTNKLERLPESFYAPKLVSLLLGGNPIQFVPESFLINFPKLRVLEELVNRRTNCDKSSIWRRFDI